MKTNIKIFVLAFILLFFSGSAFSDSPVNDAISGINVACASVLENAVTKYNAIAFIRDGEVYFRLYRGNNNGVIHLKSNGYLIEKRISNRQNDSTEDRLLTLQLRRQYPTLPANINVNITRPDVSFRYSHPILVHNYKPKTFLFLCVQTSEEFGQQVVGILFECYETRSGRWELRYIWDEFRILNKVTLLKERNNMFKVKKESIDNIDIDTADRYAVLAITKQKKAEIRLIYTNSRFGNYLYPNFYVEPREARGRGFFNVSASIREVPNTANNRIYILYAYRRSGRDSFILDIIDNDFVNYYNRRTQHEIPLPDGYRLSSNDRPKIISAPYVNAQRYGFNNENDRPHKLLILYAYKCRRENGEYRDGIVVHDVFSERDIADVIPRNIGNCRSLYKPILKTNGVECFLTFQGNYKLNLDGEDIRFNYIFGKKMHLYMDGREEMSDYFLISGPRPMPRGNLEISATGVCYYAGEGWFGFKNMPIGPLTSIKLDYIGFTGEVSRDNRTIYFDWNYYPLSFRLYFLRSDSGIEKKKTEETNYQWRNMDYSELESRDAAVLLIYEGTYRNVDNSLFMPQVSDPLIFSVSPRPGNTGHNDYGSTIPEVVGIDY